MNTSTGMAHVQVIGLPWFEPATYTKVCALMSDADRLFKTYAQWHSAAQRTEYHARSSGARTVRVVLDLEQFPAWCAQHRPGLHLDAQARMAYAAFIAAQQHRARQGGGAVH